jgi:hypothetical protein
VARAENLAPGLGERIHDPDTLPSYRSPLARGPGTSRVPEPAPLRVRSRRGLRVRFEPGRDFLVWKTLAPASRTVVACIRRCSARQTRGVGYFRLGRACPRCAPKSARGRRSQRCVRSTSALRNRSYSSTRASSFPSAVPVAMPCGVVWSPSFRRLSAPCSLARSSWVRAAASPVRRRAGWAPGSSGPPDANEAGENRGSRRDSHFGDRTTSWAAFSSASRDREPIASGTLVASSVPRRLARISSSEAFGREAAEIASTSAS